MPQAQRIVYLVEGFTKPRSGVHFVGSIKTTPKTIRVWNQLCYSRNRRKTATGIGSAFAP